MQTDLVQNIFGPVANSVLGKSFFIYDFSKGTALYGKAENISRPLASLTKLMTIRVALSHTSPLEFYTVKSHDLDSDGFVGFVVGDSYRISDLISGALIASSNDSAVMLAHSTRFSDESFIETMNKTAEDLALPSLHFGNPTGLDINDTIATATGSARDILSLLYFDYRDFTDLISVSTKIDSTIKSTNGRPIMLKNTNLAIDKLPLLLASKTGYTDTAGGNLAILWREPSGETLGAAVLGSTESGRFSDMQSIHDSTDTYINALQSLPVFCSKLNNLSVSNI